MARAWQSGWLQESLLVVAVCAAVFSLGLLLSPFFGFASAIPLFICALLIVAWRTTFRAGIAACLSATLSLDFFFTAPRHTFRVLSGQDVATLCTFLAVVLFISALSSRLSEQSKQLLNRERAQTSLQRLAERSIQLDWRQSATDELCRAVRESFSFESVCIWDAEDQRFACSSNQTETEEGLRAAFMADRDFELSKSGLSIRILRSGVRAMGSMQLRGAMLEPAVAGALVSLVSLTMERARALSSEVTAQSESLSEQLRSAVLDGLAHSIKTPLTTITVSTAGVAALGGLNDVQSRLIQRVQEQAERITSLTDRLLRTARLDGKIIVRRRDADLAEIVRGCLHALEEVSRFNVFGTDQPFPAFIDPDLFRMALSQIAENALKYSPDDSSVDVSLLQKGADAEISIHNRGSFIPPSESALVFKRFYRAQGSEHRAPGTGLGLSVAKHAIDALGGEIRLTSGVEDGTTFTIQLPLPRRSA